MMTKYAPKQIADMKGTEVVLNRLAREQFKKRLLEDVQFDLTVCDIEGWDKAEYLMEIKRLIDGILQPLMEKRGEQK